MHKRHLGKLEVKNAPQYLSNVTAPTCLLLKRELDLKIFREAVIHVAKNQPNLSHGIAKDGENLRFVPSDPNYEYFEILPPATDWKTVCKKYSNQFLHADEGNKPPLKVFYIPCKNKSVENEQEVYLLPVYMHYAGDGTNGMTIVNDVLCVYEGMMYGTLNYPRLPNPPSVEDMCKSAFLMSSNNKDKFAEVKSHFVTYCLNQYIKFKHFLPRKFYRNNSISHQFYCSSNDVYENFLLKCKEKVVTVGRLFTAIKYFAYASLLFQYNEIAENELYLGCNVPINLRKRTPNDIPANCVNLAVTQCLFGVGVCKNTSFWEFVEKVKQEYQLVFDNNFHLLDFALEDEVSKSDLVGTVLKKYGTNFHICVSNMGKYPHSVKYKDFDVKSIHCVGGIWIENWDHVELMIYSTDRFNLSLIHRDDESNVKVSKYMFSLVVYLTEHISSIDETFNLENLIEKFPFTEDL